jgi:hypothetical protein
MDTDEKAEATTAEDREGVADVFEALARQEAEENLGRVVAALQALVGAVDEIEHLHRHRGLNVIRDQHGEHPAFAELWHLADRAKAMLRDL